MLHFCLFVVLDNLLKEWVRMRQQQSEKGKRDLRWLDGSATTKRRLSEKGVGTRFPVVGGNVSRRNDRSMNICIESQLEDCHYS